jgi:hypothetical protein
MRQFSTAALFHHSAVSQTGKMSITVATRAVDPDAKNVTMFAAADCFF